MFGASTFGQSPFGDIPHQFTYTVPAAETKEGQERLRTYYEALGRFVDMFARVETAVTLTLWHYAKTEPSIAKVIFAGTKTDLGSKWTKQIAEATNVKQEMRDDLSDVFQQLGIINGARNDILHYGAESVAEGNAIVSNALKAKGEPTSFPISPTSLGQMTADLRKIISHLNYRHLKKSPTNDKELNDLAEIFYSPWQYKHPVPPPTPPKREADRQPRKRGQ